MPRFLMPWTNWSRIARSAAARRFASAAPGESTGALGLSSSRSSRASSRDIFPSFPRSSTRDAALFCEAVGDFFETGDGKPLVRFGGDRVGIGDRAVCPSSDVLGMNALTSLKSFAEKPPACSPSKYLTCFKSAGVLGRLLRRRGAATGANTILPTRSAALPSILLASFAIIHATADCEAEAAAEIIRLRGAHNAVPAGFGQMRIDLEEYLQERFSCPSGETCVALFEGGTYSYPFKLHAMRNLLGHVLRDRAAAKHVEVCEVGFNAGHSTLLWLMQDPRVRVRAFDLGIHWYSSHVTGFFDAAFDSGRVEVVFGDSQETLPAFAASFNSSLPPEFCDLIFVDGDHHFAAALSDLRNLRAAARPGHHVLLMDDPDHDEVGRAWRTVVEEGTVEPFGDVYEDAHGASVYGARAAMVYGAYV